MPTRTRDCERLLVNFQALPSRSASALARLAVDRDFNVILCDLMMRGVTGMDFHSALSKLAPRLVPRVVLHDGWRVHARASTFLEHIPNRRLEKPFDTDTLRRTVSDVLHTQV